MLFPEILILLKISMKKLMLFPEILYPEMMKNNQTRIPKDVLEYLHGVSKQITF